jgi:hypothetical protein
MDCSQGAVCKTTFFILSRISLTRVFSTFRIRSSGLFPSELIWYYGYYRQAVALLGRVSSPIARPLPTQDNTNTEEMRTDIHASSRIRTHDPVFERVKTFDALDHVTAVRKGSPLRDLAFWVCALLNYVPS